MYGARSVDLLAGIDDFTSAGIDLQIATDDGTSGHHGFVTDLLKTRFANNDRPALVIACGPAPMLAAVTRIAEQEHVDCLLSLENHMACGFGVCFSCVAPIKQADGSIDLRRVCVEGPIFPANTVVFA
jgi:dihydroorotate dehydrogenase electron transfer subunit